MPVSGGPYLTTALFCEKVLQEQDGVASFIRVVDRWNIIGQQETMQPTIIQTYIFVSMRSGIHRGGSQIIITPITPSSQRMQPMVFPVVFEGDDDRGVAVAQQIGFPVREPGVYWFEVSTEGTVHTYIPLRVSYLRTSSSGTLPGT